MTVFHFALLQNNKRGNEFAERLASMGAQATTHSTGGLNALEASLVRGNRVGAAMAVRMGVSVNTTLNTNAHNIFGNIFKRFTCTELLEAQAPLVNHYGFLIDYALPLSSRSLFNLLSNHSHLTPIPGTRATSPR